MSSPNEDAADTCSKSDARGSHRTGCQDRKLIAAMAFRDPCRVVAQALSQHDEIDDLGRVGAAANRNADLSHL
jgi:hypothetical protein